MNGDLFCFFLGPFIGGHEQACDREAALLQGAQRRQSPSGGEHRPGEPGATTGYGEGPPDGQSIGLL